MTITFAPQILPEAYTNYLAGWRKRTRAEKERLARQIKEWHSLADHCVEALVQRYPIRRAWLIGSLLTPESFHAESDIDLVVEGLPLSQYFSALTCVYDLLPPGLELDLLTLETVQPGLRQRVMTEGKLLYERS